MESVQVGSPSIAAAALLVFSRYRVSWAPSPIIQLIMPIARAASVPGLMGTHWLALAAVLLNRGSTDTYSPPCRLNSIRSRAIPTMGKSASKGLAPKKMMYFEPRISGCQPALRPAPRLVLLPDGSQVINSLATCRVDSQTEV